MCESIDRDVPLMKPTFFDKNDERNPKYNAQPSTESSSKQDK